MSAPGETVADCFNSKASQKPSDPGEIAGHNIDPEFGGTTEEKLVIPGCSYYTSINTIGANSKHHDFIWSDPRIKVHPIPAKLVWIPNKKT